MNPLKPEQKSSIAERVNFIEVEIKDLNEKYQGLDWKTYSTDREARRNIERLIENLANASIDICKIMLAGEAVEIPGTYQEIILKLGELSVIDNTLAEQIAGLAKARNVLAHQYLDYKWDLIKNLIKEAPLFLEKFIKKIGI